MHNTPRARDVPKKQQRRSGNYKKSGYLRRQYHHQRLYIVRTDSLNDKHGDIAILIPK